MLDDIILLVFIHLNRIRILHGFLILRYHRVYVPYHMAYSDVFIQVILFPLDKFSFAHKGRRLDSDQAFRKLGWSILS